MRTISIVSLLSILIVSVGETHGDGLIQVLPEDGTWASFKVQTELDFQGNLQEFDRELKVSSVGKEKVEDDPGRWIEFATEIGSNKVAAKFLIAEKYLKAGEKPFEHVTRALALRRGEVTEMPADRVAQIILFVIGVPDFDATKKGEKETIKIGEKEIECIRRTGTSKLDGPQGISLEVTGTLWTSSKVPFGTVKAEVTAESDQVTFSSKLQYVESGKDAKSLIKKED